MVTGWRDSKVRMATVDTLTLTPGPQPSTVIMVFPTSGLELQVRTLNCSSLDAASENPRELTVSLGPDEVSFMEFVRQGWRRENAQPGSSDPVPADGWTSKSAPALRFRPSEYFDSRLVCPSIISVVGGRMSVSCRREDVFYLDGEEIDIRGPTEISLLPER